MRLSTQKRNPEVFQLLSSNVQTILVLHVLPTIRLPREASVLHAHPTMKSSMKGVRFCAEMELRMELKNVMTITLSVGMAVHPPALKNFTIFVQDSLLPALFRVSVETLLKRLLLSLVMTVIIWLMMAAQTHVR